MADLKRPPLDPEVYESIEVEQHNVHTYYIGIELILFNSGGYLYEDPPPPKRPVRLCRTLGHYACALFDVEARKYPDDLISERWFTALAYRIEEKVMEALTRRSLINVAYHATRDQMRAAIRDTLMAHAKTILEDPKKIAGLHKQGTQRRAARTQPTYAKRALWLKEQLRVRGWDKYDLAPYNGLNHKTVQKILDGRPVRENVLTKLSEALSNKGERVRLVDIPQN